jgi:uncharacterized protein YrrD
MELKEGTSVYTRDGQEVGKISRFVLDPGTNHMTHVVVQKGWLLREDKVVPIEMIDTANEERVELNEQVKNYEDLPPFEETHYVNATDEEGYRQRAPGAFVPASYWYPPMGYVADRTYGPNVYTWPPIEVKQNIPAYTVPLKEGANIISVDGKHVGDLERLFVASDTNNVTHFVISQGLLLKERKLVSAGWVKSVDEDEVHLSVSADFLDRLPAYHEHVAQRE